MCLLTGGSKNKRELLPVPDLQHLLPPDRVTSPEITCVLRVLPSSQVLEPRPTTRRGAGWESRAVSAVNGYYNVL